MNNLARYTPKLLPWLAVTLSLTAMHASTAANPILIGTVSDDSGPRAGAQVTAKHHESRIEVTTFSDPQGQYSLSLDATGDYDVRASWSTQASDPVIVTLANDAQRRLHLNLQADPYYLDRVTSEQWLSLLPDGAMKREFILNCTSCHEIDADRILVHGKPRSRQQWATAFAMMRSIDQYSLIPPDFNDATYIEWLTKNITEKTAATLAPKTPANVDKLATIRITEYPLPDAGELPHDLVVGPDGRIWITAFFTDVIWAMEPTSGDIETYSIRPANAAGWGQARALIFDDQSNLWVVLGGTHELVALNVATRAIKTYNIGMYAHSLARDNKGRIWFNDYFAEKERIGVLDPITEQVRHIDIPTVGLTKQEGLPLPYGLQIDSSGRLYSTQMAANTIVMYDTNTAATELLTMPTDNTGPRRPAIGKNDMLWVPEWNTGHLSSFNPHKHSFKRYRLASSTLGAYDAEYDRRSGHIWVSGALASSMVVFDPDSESVLEIPLPTNPGYTRHLAVDPKTGDLWSAYSSLPAAKPKVVRIERCRNL